MVSMLSRVGTKTSCACRPWTARRSIAPTPAQWSRALEALAARAHALGTPVPLAIYPWDILTEIRTRLASPQAMLLVVPNGKVKLLNALPFAVADLRRDSIGQAWVAYQEAWRSRPVRAFVERCATEPELLRHANETWELGSVATATGPT